MSNIHYSIEETKSKINYDSRRPLKIYIFYVNILANIFTIKQSLLYKSIISFHQQSKESRRKTAKKLLFFRMNSTKVSF